MGGTLTLSNTSAVAQRDWSFSFFTNQPGFESWSAESSVTDLGGGTYQVMIIPPAWGLEIPAGGSVDLAFNANSVGLPATGDLTNALFFVNGPGAGVVAPVSPENSDTSSLVVIETLPVVEASPVMAEGQGLSVSATITGGWSGVFAGEISVTNLGDVSAGTDWSVALVMDAPLTSVSNFEVESELRSDGRYDVSLSPKAWSAPLDQGVSLTSYYQAAGEATDPAQVFDFGDVVVSDRSVTTLEQTDPPAQTTESADSVMVYRSVLYAAIRAGSTA
jgi:chitinase